MDVLIIPYGLKNVEKIIVLGKVFWGKSKFYNYSMRNKSLTDHYLCTIK